MIEKTAIKIFLALYNERKPLLKSHLAKKIGTSIQNIDYHLPKLVEYGLIEKNSKKLTVPEFFFNEKTEKMLIPLLHVLMELIIESVPEEKSVSEKKRVLKGRIYGFIEILLS